MSLRLPSQNKFRPTVRPGQKKAPPVRPPSNTPTSTQSTVAASSSQQPSIYQKTAPSSSQQPSTSQRTAPIASQPTASQASQKAAPSSSQTPSISSSQIPSTSASQVPAPSSSDPPAPLSSSPEASTSSQPQVLTSSQSPVPALVPSTHLSPSSTASASQASQPLQANQTATPSAGLSQSPNATQITPRPISSSQVRVIESGLSPVKASVTQDPNGSSVSTVSETPAHTDGSPSAIPLTTLAIPSSTPQPTTTKPSSLISTSPKATFAVPAPPASTPKLSLLNAARQHSSDAPSPGQLRRRTPSLASRSERGFSATPQPQRAPSVTPFTRAPSITPQSRGRPPSATPQPPSTNDPPGRIVSIATPSPRQSTSGLPPSLGSYAPSPSPRIPTSSHSPSLGTSASAGLPPSLGTTSAPSAPAPQPVQLTSREQAEALAAAVVNSIKRPKRQVRKGRRRVAQEDLQKSGISTPEEGNRIVSIRTARRPGGRANTEDRSTSEDEEGSEVSTDPETGEKRGSLTEDEDGRPIKRQKKQRPRTVATISLHDVQPDEFIGTRVDELMITMGDLATTLAAQGKVSTRAVKIDEFKRAEDEKKKEATRIRQEHEWRRNQIKRRKVRQTKNLDRARRREELGRLGMDDADVSQDEGDSEEEYEVEPERLTPESTPEPDARREPSTRPFNGEEDEDWDENGEIRNDDEDYNDVPVNNDSQEPLFLDNQSQIDGEEGEGEGGIELTAEDIAAQEEADADDAILREMGISLRDADDPMGADDEEDYEEPNWELDMETDYPDIEAYRRDQERERRRIREQQERDDGEVVEIDDETRFINAASFAKYTRPQRWTRMETELFYQVLEETGENYTLMKAYFPGRTVKQLKLKGLRENKANLDKMTAAILARKPIDKDYLTKSAGFDPTKPWDKEEALFDEAKNDADRLRRLDSVRPDNDGQPQDVEDAGAGVEVEGEGLEGEGVEGDVGFDDTMIQEEEDGFAEEGEEQEEEVGEEEENDEAEGNE